MTQLSFQASPVMIAGGPAELSLCQKLRMHGWTEGQMGIKLYKVDDTFSLLSF